MRPNADKNRRRDKVRDYLWDLLERSGENYSTLAAKIGKNRSFISQFMRGDTPRLKKDVAMEIGALLGVDYKYLLYEYWASPEEYDRNAARMAARIGGRSDQSFDRDLLTACTQAFEEALTRTGLRASPKERARAVTLLYEYFSATKVPVNDEIFDLMAKAISTETESA